ncbi:MAG: RpiB/LacA/LacB family sugar-phosphate isomerase [Syntrophales bacterium]
MRIAVVSEVSAVEKNPDILEALKPFSHQVFNLGMKRAVDRPELTYIETGFLGAMLLNLKRVDLVVGGCGTGQGFLNSVMQYPNVFAGLIIEPLDAWLFGQINGGNCISLALNKGYGWAGGVQLRFIFQKLFDVEFGCGYPEHRQASQRQSREKLQKLSETTHLSFQEVLERVDSEMFRKAITTPGVAEVLDIENLEDDKLKKTLIKKCNEVGFGIG